MSPVRVPKLFLLGIITASLVVMIPATSNADSCKDAGNDWLMCEDFESSDLDWNSWFEQSAFIECNGCPNGLNDPNRIQLSLDPESAHWGEGSLHMPATAAANFRGASLTYRSCAKDPRPGCLLTGYEELYFRSWVRLAPDHSYVHHFLSLGGTRPDAYWESDGNAGCRPNGYRSAGTTLDFNADRELFFYTYFPDMKCDSGGYCSGEYAQQICDGCATKDMACQEQQECCWGNSFAPDPPVILPRDQWVCLEMHMRLNTPGLSDGEMSFWIDDRLAHRQSNMHWRDVPELQLNKAWLQHYIAEGDSDQSNEVWFDDVVVSTKRIGCGQDGDNDSSSDDDSTHEESTGDGESDDDDDQEESSDSSTTTESTATDLNDSSGACACRIEASTHHRIPPSLFSLSVFFAPLRRRHRRLQSLKSYG